MALHQGPRPVVKLALAVVAVLALALGGAAQDEAGGGDEVMTGGNARCLDCHLVEGMTYVDLYPEKVLEVPAGSSFTVNVTLVNPWNHHIENATMSLNLSGTEALQFAGEHDPHFDTSEGTLENGEATNMSFPVLEGATEAVVTLSGGEGNLGLNDWDLVVRSPQGTQYNGTQDGLQEALQGAPTHQDAIRLGQEELLSGGYGEWQAEVTFAQGDPTGNAYTVDVQVYYNASQVEELFVGGPKRLDFGEQHTYTFRLQALKETGPVQLRYKATANMVADVPKDHPGSGIANIQNEGIYWESHPTGWEVGDELRKESVILKDLELAVNPIILLRSYAFISGFSAAFLVPVALFLGGTFGRGSVHWLNKAMGARRRVLWHNAASYSLLIIGVFHMVAFLWEPTREWTKGLLFGGVALACVAGLGVTGALQRRFIAKYGYPAWRFVHLSMALLMVFSLILHLTIDGTDFQFVRDLIP